VGVGAATLVGVSSAMLAISSIIWCLPFFYGVAISQQNAPKPEQISLSSMSMSSSENGALWAIVKM
jgi:hypothetical protein